MSTKEEIFVGLDCSTQTLKVIAVDHSLKIVYEGIVNYDVDLPQFKTQGGVHHHEDGLTITTPALVWVTALDVLFEKMKKDNFPFARVVAVSGSGQQHGSVYWKTGAREKLKGLIPGKKISEQWDENEIFSIKDSPVWMDSSTEAECRALEAALGGPQRTNELTGSRAFERFTGNQIAKLRKKHPDALNNTERISLVSSFVASLFLGDYAPIDGGDASGMNLMNIQTKKWVEEALRVCDENVDRLKSQLGEVVDCSKVIGTISTYFQETYGFSSKCVVAPFSGDNPCSLAGLKLASGDIAVSLGTSDTLFGPLATLNLSSVQGSVMCNPVNPDGHMILLCFKNGSLTREWVRDQFADKDWASFNTLLSLTPPGNNGRFGIYFAVPEITPTFNYRKIVRFDEKGEEVPQFDAAGEVRAVIEGHFFSLFSHATIAGVRATSLWATGGASANSDIIQILADIFGVPVYITNQPNSACLGAAYIALHSWTCQQQGKFVPFPEIVGTGDWITQTKPRESIHILYKSLLPKYEELEKRVVQIH